ncbi:MAG: hypothetical protein AAF846_23435 [Chloroflexota bacterium]
MIVGKFKGFVIVLMLVTLNISGAVYANDLNYEPTLCELAAPGLVSAGMDAQTTLKVEPDAVVAQFGEANAILEALINQQIDNDLLGLPHALHQDTALQPILVPNVESGETIEITGDASCVSYFDGNMIVRYVPVVADGINGYMIETVLWHSVSISSDGDGDTPINFNVENFVLRLLNPVYTPDVPLGGNGGILAGDHMTGADYCAGAPKSYLQVGMQAEMFATGSMQNYLYENGFQSGLSDSFALNEYGLSVMQEQDDRGLLLSPWIDPNSQDAKVVTSNAVQQAWVINPIVDIVEGPVCVYDSVDPSAGGQYDTNELAMTYWQIRVEVNGNDYLGWFPENAMLDTWWEGNPNFWQNVVTTYHLHPYDIDNSTNNCPVPQQQSGTYVEPSRGALNIRVIPTGEVIGRVEIREHILLFGEPICENGSNWWQTDRGYVAENDPTTGAQLLTPYNPDPTPMPEQPTRETGSSDSSEPPRQPETAQPTLAPIIAVTVQPTAHPTRPPRSGSCDPATGRNC